MVSNNYKNKKGFKPLHDVSSIEDLTHVQEKAILKKIGTFIAAQRKEKKLTQKDLNKLSHVSLAVIADLENGKSMPRVETLIRLSLAMGINPNETFEMMKIKTLPLFTDSNTKVKSEAELASTIAGFGYSKDMVNEIMEYIDFIEYKYSKKH